MYILNSSQKHDIKTVVDSLNAYVESIMDQIIDDAVIADAEYVSFSFDVSLKVNDTNGKDCNFAKVDCKLPKEGNYYDKRTLLVKEVDYSTNNQQIISILNKGDEEVLKRIYSITIGNLSRELSNRGFRYTYNDLHDFTSAKSYILK